MKFAHIILTIAAFAGVSISASAQGMLTEQNSKVVKDVELEADFVVAGEKMGPEKRKKAEELGIKIIDETEFINMINNPVISTEA